jgi:Subtilase family
MAAQGTATPPTGEAELVVIFKPTAQVQATPNGLLAGPSVDISSVQAVLDRHDASIRLLFGRSEDRLRKQQEEVLSAASADATGPGQAPPDLASFYRVQAPSDKLAQLAEQLRAEDQVEAAYVKPAVSPAVFTQEPLLRFSTAAVPATTPNFRDRQTYLGPAPGGIDAIPFAHDRVGGQGEGIRVIDCEWAWRFSHEDLGENQGGVVFGGNDMSGPNVEHGTAVAGILGGDRNQYGVTGIVPRAIFSASSWATNATGAAIKAAADKLRAGDLILLEGHRWGPKSVFIPIEWWPDDMAAIQYAVAKGIIVVEAGGNGYENLDDPLYNTPYAGFPSWWKNPFNIANPPSGAVFVGAGAPPPGTHGRDWGPDRSRLSFSNYGQRLDAQGWGVEVTTTGYGDLQGGVSPDLWYTDAFNGTSSASPIVTGALAAVSGILKDFGRPPLTSHRARKLLRATGSPQQDGPNGSASQRIGNRPNLRQLIAAALDTA